MSGRTYARRMQSETGDRGWLSPGGAYRGAYILDAPASRDMVGCPGCARGPRRGPCGYEGGLSVKRASGGVMVRKSAPRPLKGAVAGIRCCYGGRSHSAWCGEGRCGSGRAGSGLSRGRPAAYPRAPVIVLSLFVVACSRFVSCRVVMRCHWVSPPCFLIVYAPAMRAVAYYALGWGCSCASHGPERGVVSRAVGWRVHFALL